MTDLPDLVNSYRVPPLLRRSSHRPLVVSSGYVRTVGEHIFKSQFAIENTYEDILRSHSIQGPEAMQNTIYDNTVGPILSASPSLRIGGKGINNK
jgi:hypothetical protein